MSLAQSKIYFIDDSQFMLKAFQEQLEQFGFEVTTFNSAKECLTFLEESKELPDCILTDFEMPEMNGIQFCKKIKESKRYKSVPALILTASDQKKHLLEAIQSGADDFINKNIDIEIIVYKIHALIRFGQLLKKQVQLERFRTANAMIATYNHEINNPLAIAFGMLGKSFEKVTPEKYEKTLSALSRIKSIVRKIGEVTNSEFDFTDYSKDSELVELDGKNK